MDFEGTDGAKALSLPKDGFGGGAGVDVAGVEVGKLRPPKASASPPNASCACVDGDVVAPKEGSRL